jgi:cytochrome c peroxidase
MRPSEQLSKRKPASRFRAGLAACCVVAGLQAALAAPAAPAGEAILPLPQAARQDPAKVALGRRLFSDARLSGDKRQSCAACHNPAAAQSQPGARPRPGVPDAPTVFNAAFNFRQYWDGRAATLEQQAGSAIENPAEMAAHWADVLRTVEQDADYRRGFSAAFRDGVTRANIEQAIAAYERTLTTPGSRFDRYLRGDYGAISAAEREGYARFKQAGCVACHQGVNVGGNMYQQLGVMEAYPDRDATGRRFKVPSLRNVASTAPYLHDGSAATLEQAIAIMFRYQLGRPGSKEDLALIAQFLATLSAPPGAQP